MRYYPQTRMHRTRWRDAREFHRSPHTFELESNPCGGGEYEFETPPAKSEAGIVADAVQAGNYDENQITNAIFFQRHRDRVGTKIGANERQLANEWLNIRDQLVRPPLRAIGITPIDVRPYRALVPLLENTAATSRSTSCLAGSRLNPQDKSGLSRRLMSGATFRFIPGNQPPSSSTISD